MFHSFLTLSPQARHFWCELRNSRPPFGVKSHVSGLISLTGPRGPVRIPLKSAYVRSRVYVGASPSLISLSIFAMEISITPNIICGGNERCQLIYFRITLMTGTVMLGCFAGGLLCLLLLLLILMVSVALPPCRETVTDDSQVQRMIERIAAAHQRNIYLP